MTWIDLELLVKLTLYHILGIVANTHWWDAIPSKQQWQSHMCFTSGCNWESSSSFNVCCIYLCNSVAPSGHCTGKHHVWKYRMCQATIMKIFIIYSEWSWQWSVEHRLKPSLYCGLDSHLSILRDDVPSFCQDYRLYWWFSDHAYLHYVDLNLGWQCSSKIIIIHNISRIISKCVWDNCADKYWSLFCCGRDTDLTSMI